ncbi:MAG: metal-dependent hydrolase [Woeseiaceae bacterium]|nr:metal-dependent hydrolase [Woeseiaceae bacterium]
MDSVSQAVLGASIAGIIAPPGQRRRALLAGAALGTLPDLDVLIRYDDVVENFTYHRGFSHSILVLVPLSAAIWALLIRLWAPARAAPRRWLAAIVLVLATHPLLDCHTAYGTQLLWPLASPPISWATMFIIDPLYTLPLIIGVATAAIRPLGTIAGRSLAAGLTLSALYIGWSWHAQGIVERNARESLAAIGIHETRLFVTPTPFNTLLWRVVALTDYGFLEGLDSLAIDDGAIEFQRYSSDVVSLRQADNVWAVRRLQWFARGFVSARIDDDRLVISDLRMGQAPVYVFSHVVARSGNPHWIEIPGERLPVTIDDRALGDVFRRIWTDAP